MVIDNQMNPGKYSVDELNYNYHAAYADATYAADAYAREYAYAADAYAREYAYAVAYACDAYMADFWLYKYFNLTGENKQDYIDAINKLTTK